MPLNDSDEENQKPLVNATQKRKSYSLDNDDFVIKRSKRGVRFKEDVEERGLPLNVGDERDSRISEDYKVKKEALAQFAYIFNKVLPNPDHELYPKFAPHALELGKQYSKLTAKIDVDEELSISGDLALAIKNKEINKDPGIDFTISDVSNPLHKVSLSAIDNYVREKSIVALEGLKPKAAKVKRANEDLQNKKLWKKSIKHKASGPSVAF
jgi:hypothetical protein